jgi:hypothetical protein
MPATYSGGPPAALESSTAWFLRTLIPIPSNVEASWAAMRWLMGSFL